MQRFSVQLVSVLLVKCSIAFLFFAPAAQAQDAGADSLCPRPAIDRFTTHTSTAGETLTSIASQYSLTPETLLGVNRAFRSGLIPAGSAIVIPPFNGIRFTVPRGMLLGEIAKKYKVRPDVLFEINGCQPNPREIFIPGVKWTIANDQPPLPAAFTFASPVPTLGEVLTPFGFLSRSGNVTVIHSGIDLAAPLGSPVLAAAPGTIAFAGTQGALGKTIVINHAQGYQTRYAQLDQIQVKTGQTVQVGDAIGTIGQTGKPSHPSPHLHFEVRSNSPKGWIAEDPQPLLKSKT